MKEFIEKLIGRLEEKSFTCTSYREPIRHVFCSSDKRIWKFPISCSKINTNCEQERECLLQL